MIQNHDSDNRRKKFGQHCFGLVRLWPAPSFLRSFGLLIYHIILRSFLFCIHIKKQTYFVLRHRIIMETAKIKNDSGLVNIIFRDSFSVQTFLKCRLKFGPDLKFQVCLEALILLKSRLSPSFVNSLP